MIDKERQHYAIIRERPSKGNKTLCVVKGISAANLIVDRKMLNRSPKQLAEDVTYHHDETTAPVTVRTKKTLPRDKTRQPKR
jgi:hypothetical protein